jgi:hypothetical protein
VLGYISVNKEVIVKKSEYDLQKQRIEKRANRLLGKLAYDYAMANSTVKVGDIVTDHLGSIMVEDIQANLDK